MKQIKYNGVTYNVYVGKENPDPDHQYESIVQADTREMVSNEMDICRKFLVANNSTIDKGKNTRSNIRKLHSVLQMPGAINELPLKTGFKSPIDFLLTLNYIEKFGNKSYKSLDKCSSQTEKNEMEEIKNKASNANKQVTNMARVIEAEYGLENWKSSNWLDGTKNKARDYLWVEMRYEDYKDNKNSISIFINKSIPSVLGRDKPRIRFSIEMRDSGATQTDYDYRYRFLDMPLKPGLCYIVASNQLHDAAVFDEDAETVKQKLKDGIYKKVQISKVINYDPSLTNEQIYNEMMQGVKDLIPYYDHVIGKTNKTNQPAGTKPVEEKTQVINMNEKIGLNTILFGPPGTGKTYNTKRYVVAICDYNGDLSAVEGLDYDTVITPRYNELVSEGRVQFTTFHQSYGYEEFIEGIKPIVNENKVIYDTVPGVFKKFCETASIGDLDYDSLGINLEANIWKVSLYGDKVNILKECFDENYIGIGFNKNSEDNSVEIFKNKMNIGDIVLSLKSFYEINGIAIIVGNYEELKNKPEYIFARKVKWLFKDKIINVRDINGGYRLPIKTCSGLPHLSRAGVMKIIKENIETSEGSTKPYVFVIDEINRGNISKIFGELITLIEESKRGGVKEEMSATLPYSGERFSVPNNVYILGTMNTADRSISLMDTALRRRFDFIEMMSKPSIVNKIVAGVDIEKMLKTINDRITVLYDREHTIGHAFFTGLDSNSTIYDLESIFKNKVIPLLQEYFYEDYSKIRLVLGDNGKSEEKYQFVKEIDNSKNKTLFKGNYDPDLVENFCYALNCDALKDPESYIQIYK